MSYCINLGDWGSVFAVPSAIVDKHIKLVGSSQLKVLMWILRNSGKDFSEKDLSEKLSIHIEDVKDAIGYWVESGIIKFVENELVPAQDFKQDSKEKAIELSDISKESVIEANNNKAKKSIPASPLRPLRPDISYVNKRIKGSEEIKTLMHEAELILSRPLSPGDCAVLIMLHDNEGLPVDVILMLIQYAVSVDKSGMRYIEAVGSSWAKEGVDTIEKAEIKIKCLNEAGRAWNNFERVAGLEYRSPTSKEEEAVNRWYNIWNYSPDVIKEAYEICVNANGKYVLRYIDSIITRWHNSGISTLNQIHEERKGSSKANKFSKQKKEKFEPSQDTIDYEKNYNIFDEINLLRESLNNEV